ncbi:TonB-dependent receptor [Pacificimonas flava]|uniref:TonB-dependent receptor n=2 Tax=Pacificimonas TaxID=1960290 RepID=A0A219B4V9_9SPHN|nr:MULTISPECIES: TonB-dependent receptor [Pacificimonas]MBZ6379500.1 TonB-dependent receptor [Pacificimonas aurantium]OWV33311.1 TonB-dependent receptor [Pacificimonas flava]
MTKSIFRAALRTSTALVAATAVVAPALAQDAGEDETITTAPDALSDAPVTRDVIVVTGSRISNPNLELTSPVTVIGEEELAYRQTNTAEQFIRELPGAVPSIGSAVNNGNGGASFVNLRGLGSVRNLVLLDGRRFVPADTTGRVDLNSIPLAVIERTDILTGGATTTYGADAVAGVVNFITKDDFEGAELVGNMQIAEEGDAKTYRLEGTIGANFDDGRGNAVFSIGYQKQDPVYQGDRDFSEFNVGSFSGEASGSSNAVPAVIVGPVPGGAGQITQDRGFTNDLTLFNFNPFNIFQTPFDRFNIFGSARYELVPEVEFYTQGAFSKQTVSTIIAPGGSFFNTYRLNLNNPFLGDGLVDAFCEGLGLTAAECAAGRSTEFGPTLADGSTNPDYVEFDTQVRRRTVEAGTRNSDFTTTLFNYVAGFRGDITDNISWDIYGTYGESERIQRQGGFARFSRLQPALLAIPDGSGGAQCIDQSGGCIPLDIFGPGGSLNADGADYVFGLTQQVINQATIKTVNASITGDFGDFRVAEEPIAFAIGAEYREFTATRISDEASQTPGEVVGGGGAAPDVDGSYDVKDLYGELYIPLLAGTPGFEELTLELGARYSDYSTAGTEFTWKAGGSWTPFYGATVRGNFQKAARAPNIGELFLPVVTGLDNLANDPCQLDAPVNDSALAALCIAQGAPAAVVNAGGILAPAAGQINITTGGNPDLGTEEATTWSVGLLLQPEFVPGLALTVDYFNIEITDAISSPTVGDIIQGCYFGGDLNYSTNDFCQLIERNPFTGGLDGSPDSTPGVILQQSNLGTLKTDGIDATVNYDSQLTDTVGLGLSFTGTWTFKNEFQSTPDAQFRDCVGFYSVNCGSIQPEFVFNQRTTLFFGESLNASLLWRFLDGVEQEPRDIAENGEAFVGNSPLFGDVDFTQIDSFSYFDLSMQYAVEPVTLTFTVQNLFDKKPPIVGSDIGSTAYNSGNTYPSTYDAIGRRYGVTAKLRF